MISDKGKRQYTRVLLCRVDLLVYFQKTALTPTRYRESGLARAHVFSARIGASLKMSPGPTPRCGNGYVVADVDALLGHWPIAFSCLSERGAFFFALMAS
jgi:hypothetical protein